MKLETQLHPYQWWHQSFGTQDGKHQLISELGHISSVQELIMSTVWALFSRNVRMPQQKHNKFCLNVTLCVVQWGNASTVSQNSDVILSGGRWNEKPCFDIAVFTGLVVLGQDQQNPSSTSRVCSLEHILHFKSPKLNNLSNPTDLPVRTHTAQPNTVQTYWAVCKWQQAS